MVDLHGDGGAFRLLLAANPLPMCVYELGTLRFLEVNDAAVALYGYSREQFLTMTVADVHPAEDVTGLRGSLESRGEVLERSGTWRHRKADGRIIDVEVTSHLLDWDGRTGCLVVVQDVTEARRLHAELARRVLYDEGTGLANASFFADRVAGAIARRLGPGRAGRAAPRGDVGVVMVGLGSLGELASTDGDEVVAAVVAEAGRRISAACGEADLVGRFSGGRLGVLSEDRDRNEVLRFAASIADRLAAPLDVAGWGQIAVPAWVGVAFAGGDDDAAAVVRNATWAMRHAPDDADAEGRRLALYDQAARQEATEVAQARQALEGAAAEGQLRLHYQPVIDLGTGTVIACESLLRWARPGFGLVPPDRFVPIAERSGLIVEIGGWVIDHAIAEAASWPERTGIRPKVAVNLTVRQLRDERLLERFATACEVSGLAPSSVCAELTESTLVRADDRDAYRALSALRDTGVAVAIDDFGTGYSSLSYLKRLPVDVIKVDRGFVSGLGADPADRVLVEAVVGAAHALGLSVTAEGVETVQQLDELRSLDCDSAQGFLLARPVPADELLPAMGAAERVARGPSPAG
jgi:PAS domain S-box-containing protein